MSNQAVTNKVKAKKYFWNGNAKSHGEAVFKFAGVGVSILNKVVKRWRT